MKKNIKIYVLVIASFIFLYNVPVSYANEFLMVQNTTAGNSCNANSGDFWQSFTATNSNISRFYLRGGTGYNGAGATSTLHIHNRATSELLYAQVFPPVAVSNNVDMEYVLTNPVGLEIGTEYQLQFDGTTGISNYCSCNGCNPYAGGEWNFNNTIDLYFRIYYSDSVATTSLINITYPTNNATYNGSPLPITFNYSNPASAYSQIIFNLSRLTPNAQTMTPAHFYMASTTAFINNIVFKNLINGSYRLYAYQSNWNGTGNSLPTANVDFTIASSTYNDGSALIIPYDILPNTCLYDISECDNISSTDFYSGITCGFKKSAIWALCPSSEVQTKLTSSYNDLKNSFPFSAFFDLTDIVSGAISSTTLSMNDKIEVPFISATGTIVMLPVLASTSMPNLIGQTNTNLIRNSITWILWSLAGFLIFITIKKI